MLDNIKVYEQNSIRISSENGVIYVDPFRIPSEMHDADYILITHDHYDHFSTEDIEKVAAKKTILVVPEKMEKTISKVLDLVSKVVTVKPGSNYEIDGLELDTVAAYNLLRPFHPKSSGWVGYILMVEGKRIYIAGDTDATKEAKAVKCDVAMVPIGGTYTMNAKSAAELINEICPEIAIPVHYGSIVGSPEDGKVFADIVKPPIDVQLMI